MKVIWVSANKLGYELLQTAMEVGDFELKAIITLGKNSKTVMYDAIDTDLWHSFNVPVHEVDKLNEEESIIKNLNPDLAVVCGWRQIVNLSILKIPKYGTIGFHPTPLPKGRGPAPIINTILEGWKSSALTLFYLAEGLDNGDIIGQKNFPIEDSDHASDVYNKIIISGKSLIKEYLPLIIKQTAPRIKQIETEATLFNKLTLKDNEININEDSLDTIDRKIRALSKPYKGAHIQKDGKKLIIWKSELVK
jgi:methionyl-tRNA formyltransferase